MFYQDTYLSLELTDFCNCSCIMCSQSVNNVIHGNSKGFISIELVRKIFNDLLAAGIRIQKLLPFGLGEPLLHPDFPDFVKLLKEYKEAGLFNMIDLHTNGQLLDENMKKCILDNWVFDTISFSIDAVSSETYRKIRRHNGFNNTISNINSFITSRKSNKPRCIIQFIVMEANFDECENFINNWKQFFHLNGIDFQLNFDWWPEMISDTIFIKKLNPFSRSDISKALKLHDQIKNRYVDNQFQDKTVSSQSKVCSGPFKFISISWDGTVTVCCIDTERELAIGNVNNTSIIDIWNNEKVNQIRKGLIDMDYTHCSRCQNCSGMDSPLLTKSDIMIYEGIDNGIVE